MQRSLSIGIMLSLLILSGCATNPVTRQSEFMIYSEQQELEMGKQYHPEILDEYGPYTEQKLSAYVNLVGQKVAAVSNRPHLDYTFTVLDSPIVNAFAVPGGYIYITRGLLEKLNSEDELAGVLGHEVGHVAARDSVRTMSGQLGFNLLLLGASAVVKAEDLQAWSPWISGGAFLAMRSYGRDAEFQADELGSRYSVAAGYSARGNTDVLRELRKLGDSDPGSLEELLATHPSTALRVDKARALQKELEDEVGKLPEKKDSFKDALAGMVIGPNERHGKIIGNAYLNKMYDTYFEFPDAMKKTTVGQPGVLFYAKAPSNEFVALQAITLAQPISAREYAAAAEKQGGMSAVEAFAKKAGGMEGWVARYSSEEKNSFISRFYAVEGTQALILTCTTTLTNQRANRTMFDEALGSMRKLTASEKAKLTVKHLEVYTIASGDTLPVVAKKYNVPAKDIIEYNSLETSDVYVGQRLKIPQS